MWTWRDALLFVRVFLFAASVPLLLRLKLAALETLVEPRHTPPAPSKGELDKIVICVDHALMVGRPLIRPGCLTRGVTRYYFLKRAGAEVSLCFRMAKVGDEFVGHCWLTNRGEPFLKARVSIVSPLQAA